jgi:hypothetical protein
VISTGIIRSFNELIKGRDGPDGQRPVGRTAKWRSHRFSEELVAHAHSRPTSGENFPQRTVRRKVRRPTRQAIVSRCEMSLGKT